MARPLRFTQQQMIAAIEEHHGFLARVADALHASRQTVLNYIKHYPAVAEALYSTREEMIDTAEKALFEAIERGKLWAV